ncbi:Uncharacterized membrane protein [Alkalibacterium putridalgicola]|uniref:Uncharacterized membrane protein n=1 Tax=Alkalibacterium putridalgicola TaxID=426703 RepID=A0A1H7T6R7_9LACT|nr:DUF2254 domain-containing protein [Alkalibacterium putridalgicola]GEK89334.1 hypothetical protein APU01nite_13730 [Alkalibacterium putridalgicola]SEL80473.1 Uncharacterized membrane protein [Alkalibacterium putridalgicola]
MIEKWNLSMEERKIWLTLGGSVFFSFLLAVLVILFDTRILIGVEYLPNWALTSVDLAREILGLLAGSLLTVATFTFGTMLSIVTLYTSNFSPRATENFLLNRTSMETLGIFLGGFIYCLASLFFMRSSEDEYLVISATIALVYALGAVFTFTRFVYTSSEYIQLEKLIHRLYKEAQGIYDNYIKRFENFHSIKHLPEMSYMYTFDIQATKSAYVEHIDFNTLKKIADEKDANIIINIRVGYFVTEDEPIMEIKTNQNLTDDMEDITKRVNRSLSFESEKSAMYDPDYARTKLTEVALRAVSPGINDPNTAIHVLHYKSLLEKRLAGMPGKYVIFHNEEEENDEQASESDNNSNGEDSSSSKKSSSGHSSDLDDSDKTGINPEEAEIEEENKNDKTEIISSDSEEDKEKAEDRVRAKKIKVISDGQDTENKEDNEDEKDNETEPISEGNDNNKEVKEKPQTKDKENQYEKSVFYRYNDFAEDLHSGYWQLVFYMQKDISGVHALFEALKTITYAAHLDNLGFIKEYNEYLYNMTSKNFAESFDQNIIERDYETVKTIIEKKRVELED